MNRIYKRGQVTIFIIMSLIIIIAVLVYFFYPRINISIGEDVSPQSFIISCIQPEMRAGIELLSKQGGYANPEGYIEYNGDRVKYLCYTSEYYKTCVIQQPMIKTQFERELSNLLRTKIRGCLSSMKETYESKGYLVSYPQAEPKLEIVPEKISLELNSPIVISKDNSEIFKSTSIEIPSQIYNLLIVSQDIVGYESSYGDSDSVVYIQYYPNLKIEKIKLGDGSKIYKVSDVVSKETFTFASRSLAWPAGYGIE